MNPELKKYKATSVEIRVDLDIPSEFAVKLREQSAPDDDGDSLFVAKHPRHQVWLWMISQKSKGGNDNERYQMRYWCKIGRTFRRMTPGIEDLIELLSPVISEVVIQASVDFLYKKELKPRCIMELPNRYINYPDSPFDVIKGYHLIKKATELEKEYDVILESPKQGEYFVRVTFSQSAKFDKELFENCVKKAESTATKFVYLNR